MTDVERNNNRAEGNNRDRRLSIEKVKFEEDPAARYKKKVAVEKMKQESSGVLGSFESFFREKLPFLETPAWMGKLQDAEKDLRQGQEYYVIRGLNVESSDFMSEEAEEESEEKNEVAMQIFPRWRDPRLSKVASGLPRPGMEKSKTEETPEEEMGPTALPAFLRPKSFLASLSALLNPLMMASEFGLPGLPPIRGTKEEETEKEAEETEEELPYWIVR